MKLFLRYLRSRWRVIAVFLCTVGLFFAAVCLYGLPVTAALYPAALCLLLGTAALLAGFVRVRRTHSVLTRMQRLSAETMGELPAAGTVIEADYRAVIDVLRRELADTAAADAARYTDMVEYYTVWAHQIKTPIAAMRLTLQNEDTPLSRKLSGDLLRIEQYVEMVLAFLRLDGGSDYVFRECDLDALIRSSLRKLAPEFIARKLRLCYEPTKAVVLTDEKWLSFVLEQLLSNALKYTREGSITLRLTEGPVLTVTDTGIGIAPEDLPRVFDRGYTGYNGRTDKTASGIGLYLCRRICRNIGIGITVQSQVGEGTTVTLDLARYPLKTE